MDGSIFGNEMMEEETKESIKKSKKPIVEESEDEDEEEEEEEEGILDLTRKEREHAQKKLASGEMLFPEEEEDLKKKVKVRRAPSESTRAVAPVSQDILDEVGDALGDFDAETANKKKIRALRKALQHLSLARYPKKKREKKNRFDKMKAKDKKVEEPAKKAVKKLIKRKK